MTFGQPRNRALRPGDVVVGDHNALKKRSARDYLGKSISDATGAYKQNSHVVDATVVPCGDN
jgi:hypothetical protein